MPIQRKLLIGIDVGTQGTKAAIFTLGGRCLGSAFEPSKLKYGKHGVVEEDADRQVGSVIRVIKKCAASVKGSVAAIAVDGQMAGVIGINKLGRAVTPYDSWLDNRCGPQAVTMNLKAGAAIIRNTGAAASFNHGPKILWWKKHRKSVWQRIAKFVQPGGYAALRLCGLNADHAFIDWTYLHHSGFADNKRLCWNTDLCRQFSVPVNRLPDIVSPTRVIGGLCKTMATRCDLPMGTPVVAGLGDTAASFLACGATQQGIGIDVAGTASVFATTRTNLFADTKHHMLACGRSALPNLWHSLAYIGGGGMNLKWFAENVQGKTGVTFKTLDREAQRFDFESQPPMFVPHLGGRVCPNEPNLGGAWVDLQWRHRRADLYRAMLEGVALEYGLYKRALGAGRKNTLSELRVTGGGERSAVWNQIKADVLSTRVVRIKGGEGAPMGAALVAGVGVGCLDNLKTAANRWVVKGATTSPDRKKIKYYEKRLDRYSTLVTALGTWSKNGAIK